MTPCNIQFFYILTPKFVKKYNIQKIVSKRTIYLFQRMAIKYTYICIYIERERERKKRAMRDLGRQKLKIHSEAFSPPCPPSPSPSPLPLKKTLKNQPDPLAYTELVYICGYVSDGPI